MFVCLYAFEEVFVKNEKFASFRERTTTSKKLGVVNEYDDANSGRDANNERVDDERVGDVENRAGRRFERDGTFTKNGDDDGLSDDDEEKGNKIRATTGEREGEEREEEAVVIAMDENGNKLSPRKIAFLSMPKTLSKKQHMRAQQPQTLSDARVKLNEGLRHVKNEQKMRREITRSIKQHTTVAKRTAKFVHQKASSESNNSNNADDEENSEVEGGKSSQHTTRTNEIDRIAWEINTKEFNKRELPWAEPFVLLCERYSRFLRNGIKYKTVPWANLIEDITAKYEADGQTITPSTELIMVTFAIERLKEIHDEEAKIRSKLEEVERKLIASAQESSTKALERIKRDSGLSDSDDDEIKSNGKSDPELSTSRGNRPNGRNNKQYLDDERSFNEAFIPKVRKLAQALLKDINWIHDEGSEEYKNMYATYDSFHKNHNSGERIEEKDIQVPKGVELGEFEKRFLPENGSPYSGKRKPSCALVGNSRALLANDQLGTQIDDHDVVMRLNQAPSRRFERYVGHKTTHRLLNAKWTQAYKSNPFLQTEPNVTFVITRTDWLTYLRAAKIISALKPNYFPKDYYVDSSAAAAASAAGEDFSSTEDTSEDDSTTATVLNEFGEIIPIAISEEDVTLSERIQQGMPTLRLLSRGAVDGAGDVLRALKQNLEIVRGKAYKGKASPSSGFLGFHLLRQICNTLDVYGVGDDIAYTGAAWHYFETQHFQSSREFGAVPHHSFTLESDVMQLLDATNQIRHQRMHVDKETMQRLEFFKGAPIREIRAPQNLGRIQNAQTKREQNNKRSGGASAMSHAEQSMRNRGYGGSNNKREKEKKRKSSSGNNSEQRSDLDGSGINDDPLEGL